MKPIYYFIFLGILIGTNALTYFLIDHRLVNLRQEKEVKEKEMDIQIVKLRQDKEAKEMELSGAMGAIQEMMKTNYFAAVEANKAQLQLLKEEMKMLNEHRFDISTLEQLYFFELSGAQSATKEVAEKYIDYGEYVVSRRAAISYARSFQSLTSQQKRELELFDEKLIP